MKIIAVFLLIAALLCGCAGPSEPEATTIPTQAPSTHPAPTESATEESVPTEPAPTESLPTPALPCITVSKVDGLSEDFIMGADVSSLISLENSGVVFRNFQGEPQDLLKTLSQVGINYIRVRVWNNPYDAQGNSYGGGNCDLNNAIAIGQRASQYGMKLFLDLHYSDFWADPSKQQVPKAWTALSFAEKSDAIYEYTVQTLQSLKDAGVKVGMIQIGNETTGGFCGEWTAQGQYPLMARAAQAVRDADSSILIAVHFTNPEKGAFPYFAECLHTYRVNYDVFATSYYPYWHGTIDNLKSQLGAVVQQYGKKVMVAETSWAYTPDNTDDHHNSVGANEASKGPYPFTVQGQATELHEVISAIASFGDTGIGVCYWEPAWIAVPGENWSQRSVLWEQFGSGWASSFAGEYDPNDAGKYYGGSACDNQALFDKDGYPLESLMTFTYVRTGQADNERSPSDES